MIKSPIDAASNAPSGHALDLSQLPLWLIERGMRGVPLDEQVAGFCQQVLQSGLPIKRVQMGTSTLHPKYGSHTFLWRADDGTIEHKRYERAANSHEFYLKSPVHYMRTRGLLTMRRRLGGSDLDAFPLLQDLRAEGLTDYAAQLVPFDRQDIEALAGGGHRDSHKKGRSQGVDGVFLSYATDRPEGFSQAALDQVYQTLPYLALAVKSRLTYDIANSVLGTYLGHDAGHRVLSGAIERGSAEAIRAVIWFSDLRGFTKLTDSLPRDQLVETLDSYLEAMADPIHASNGQILKIMGDGLLAIFDLTDRDDTEVCREALTAAAELRASLPTFNQARRAGGKAVMDFGLALHMGEVFYGNIGASDRLDFTVIGPAVNEASRIQSLCRSLNRDVLVSSTFKASASSEANLESLGLHSLRGVRKSQELFGLLD